MSTLQLLKPISKFEISFVCLLRIYLSLFNVWVSFVIQQGINISSGVVDHSSKYLYSLLIALVLSSFFYGIIYYRYTMQVEKIRIKISEKIATQVMDSMLFSDSEQELSQGKVINLINQDVRNISLYFSKGIMPLIEMILVIVGGVIYVMYFSWQMGLLYVCLGIVFYLVNSMHYAKLSKQYAQFIQQDDVHKTILEEIYTAFPIVRIFKMTSWLVNNHRDAYQNKRQEYERYVDTYANNISFMDSAIMIVQLMMLMIGFIMVASGHILIGTMIGLWNAGAGSILYSFADLPNIVEYLSNYKTSVDRLNDYLVYNDGSDNFNITVGSYSDTSTHLADGIYIKNLHYEVDNKKIFEGLDYYFGSKGIHYVIGKSGSGKSTLFKLIAGQLQLVDGTIMFLQNAVHVSAEKLIAYVPQKNGIFNVSLKENLLLQDNFDIYDKKNKFHELLEAFGLVELFKHHPTGLDARVGKDLSLSPGEMKRLSILRAVLSNRPYLFLDEPFADIDLNNQAKIMQVLREYSLNHSVIIITHTYDFIESTDLVLTLEGGDKNV